MVQVYVHGSEKQTVVPHFLQTLFYTQLNDVIDHSSLAPLDFEIANAAFESATVVSFVVSALASQESTLGDEKILTSSRTSKRDLRLMLGAKLPRPYFL
jgi:hypothetical protein